MNHEYNVSPELAAAIEEQRTQNLEKLAQALRDADADDKRRRQTLIRVALPTLALIGERRPMRDPFKFIGRLCNNPEVHVAYLGNLVEIDGHYQSFPNPDNPRAMELAQADPIELENGVVISRQQLAELVDKELAIEDNSRTLTGDISALYSPEA